MLIGINHIVTYYHPGKAHTNRSYMSKAFKSQIAKSAMRSLRCVRPGRWHHGKRNREHCGHRGHRWHGASVVGPNSPSGPAESCCAGWKGGRDSIGTVLKPGGFQSASKFIRDLGWIKNCASLKTEIWWTLPACLKNDGLFQLTNNVNLDRQKTC